MAGTFAGKYAFASTNTTGPIAYLTAYLENGQVFPSVTAPALTDTEKLILYAAGDGKLYLVLAVPGTPPAATLAWLAGQADLGVVVSDPVAANAAEIAVAGLTGPTSAWSILDTKTSQWVGLEYRLQQPMASLVYATGSNDRFLTALANTQVTPSYAAIVAANGAANADLRWTDLSGLSFVGLDLSGADFTGANLTGASFAGATLTCAVFVGATLANTVFGGATLTGANFTGTNLASATFAPPLHAANALFTGAVLAGVSLASADLTGASFAGADLSHANLSGATLDSAILYGANLTGATLSSATLIGAQLGGSATTAAAVLSYAVMQNATVTRADLFGVDFSFATINGVQTSLADAATLEQANFANAYLEGISFAGSSLQGASFDGACLVDVDFSGAHLDASGSAGMPASFVAACIQGASFTGAHLGGTNFANAAVSFARGSLPVRYCTSFGMLPSAPQTLPLNYQITQGLDATTLAPSTVCPNGVTYAANLTLGLGLTAMLTAPHAPGSWTVAACLG